MAENQKKETVATSQKDEKGKCATLWEKLKVMVPSLLGWAIYVGAVLIIVLIGIIVLVTVGA